MGLKVKGKGFGMMFLGFAKPLCCVWSPSLLPRPQEFPCLCPIPTSSMFPNLLGTHTVSSQDVWSCFRASKARSESNQQKLPWEAFAQDVGRQSLVPLNSRHEWKVWGTNLSLLYSDYKEVMWYRTSLPASQAGLCHQKATRLKGSSLCGNQPNQCQFLNSWFSYKNFIIIFKKLIIRNS